MSENKIPGLVSVIGLGAMGSTLALLLVKNGYQVTVWNRTSAKAESLIREGATLATSAVAAVKASPVTVICVHNYAATDDILHTEEIENNVSGRTFIQLTSGSPKEARDFEAWTRKHGARYLDGAIQAAPSQMGRPDTPILVSGAKDVFEQHEALLKVFGGGISFIGEEAGSASAIDLATLSYVYGSVLGFFHGARIVESEGFRVDTYSDLVAGITPTFGDFLKHEGRMIQSENYEISESPLKISVDAVERISDQAHKAGINHAFPTFASALFQKASAMNLGNEELAAIIKVLRTAN
ncbi:NAD(P)-binding domain-containing protein [Rapidithrix thailandica]|uniref:NAD(P)-binding domain-containing protein n=1 Tax=Rapidithrix thailandica TaxID=413964 RepID=A0AAW9S3U0_9BACT